METELCDVRWHLEASWFSVPCTAWGPFPQFFISCSRMTIYVTLTTSGSLLLYCSLADPLVLPRRTQVMNSHQATSQVCSLFLISFYRTSALLNAVLSLSNNFSFFSFCVSELWFSRHSQLKPSYLVWGTKNYPWFLAHKVCCPYEEREEELLTWIDQPQMCPASRKLGTNFKAHLYQGKQNSPISWSSCPSSREFIVLLKTGAP